jgi:XTP/dITP diphosphohydrolase
MEIVLATHNVHKVRELREMLKTVPAIEILTLRQFPDFEPVEEDQETFEGNALKKAREAAKFLKKPVLAEDSGLVVPAIGGAPGVFSKRYAGPKGNDADNRKKLLKAMEGLTDVARNAFFQCVLVFVHPSGEEKIFSGVTEGTILTQERGGHGFGYDSLFLKHDYDKTFAEMDEATKNRVSHRRKAFDKFATYFEGALLRLQE